MASRTSNSSTTRSTFRTSRRGMRARSTPRARFVFDFPFFPSLFPFFPLPRTSFLPDADTSTRHRSPSSRSARTTTPTSSASPSRPSFSNSLPSSSLPLTSPLPTLSSAPRLATSLSGASYLSPSPAPLPSPLTFSSRARNSFTGVATGPFNQIFLFGKTEQAPAFLTGIEEIQGLLAKTEGDFLLGVQLSIGDLAVAPFVGRFFAAGKAGTSLLSSTFLPRPRFYLFYPSSPFSSPPSHPKLHPHPSLTLFFFLQGSSPTRSTQRSPSTPSSSPSASTTPRSPRVLRGLYVPFPLHSASAYSSDPSTDLSARTGHLRRGLRDRLHEEEDREDQG